MEKSNKKEKSNKENNTKKNRNNSFIIEEEDIKPTHTIPKELDKNKNILDFTSKIFNIYKDIKNATNEYCEKIKQISKQLNPNIQSYTGKIQKIINNLLINIYNTLNYSIESFEQDKDKDNYLIIYGEYKNKLDDFKKEYQQKLELLNLTKKNYIEEINKYESYLIYKELGLIDKKDDNKNNIKDNKSKDKDKDKNKNKDKDKDKDKNKNISLYDNHLKAYEQQELYLAAKDDLILSLKKIIYCINTERKLVFQSLSQSCQSFIKVIYNALQDMNNIIKEERNFYKENPINNDEHLIVEEKMIDNILKDDLYSFKILSNYKSDKKDNDEDSKNKKKKSKNSVNIYSLIEQLEEENIMKIIKKMKKNNIKFNKDNINTIAFLENKKYIESLIDLIINEPEQFDDNKKNKLVSLFISDMDNQKSFVQYLNNYRGRGTFGQKKLAITILSDLFIIIIEYALKNNYFKIIKYAIILASTYFHLNENQNNKENQIIEKDKQDNKIYIVVYLKQSKIFQDKKFWLNYMDELINEELAKIDNKKENINDEYYQQQKSFAQYSSAFALIKNMVDFDLNFNFINDVLLEIFDKNQTKDTEKIDIINYLISETQKNGKNYMEEKK